MACSFILFELRFCKMRVVEDGPGREHLCHTDTFLVFKIGAGGGGGGG